MDLNKFEARFLIVLYR